jgi:hypothetical protein
LEIAKDSYEKGLALFMKGNFGEAELEFNNSIKIHPENLNIISVEEIRDVPNRKSRGPLKIILCNPIESKIHARLD